MCIDANLERVDSTGQGYIGNGMSVSSGKWTFPSTGIWLVIASVNFENSSNNNARYIVVEQEFTNNNGTSYNVSSISLAYFNSLSSPITTNSVSHNLIDITNTSNDKMRFKVSAAEACIARGNSGFNETSFLTINE